MVSILAIHAHPDDVEFLAGGTMALLAGLGHPLTIATFTPGDCGSKQLGPEEIAAVRRREAANAAALIGARYLCLEMRDMAIFNDDASRRLVTETLRQTRPDLVLTASPVDYHCDHEAASALVRDACFAAPAPNYRTHAAAARAAARSHPASLFHGPGRRHRSRRPRRRAAFRRRYRTRLRPQTRHAGRTCQPANLAQRASRNRRLPRHHGALDTRARRSRGPAPRRRIPPLSRSRLPPEPACWRNCSDRPAR